jgi:hypothetical protein
VRLENPYLNSSSGDGSNGFVWLRGNLHAHTTLSDGQLPPEQVIAAYEQAGYDFLASPTTTNSCRPPSIRRAPP